MKCGHKCYFTSIRQWCLSQTLSLEGLEHGGPALAMPVSTLQGFQSMKEKELKALCNLVKQSSQPDLPTTHLTAIWERNSFPLYLTHDISGFPCYSSSPFSFYHPTILALHNIALWDQLSSLDFTQNICDIYRETFICLLSFFLPFIASPA